MADKAGMRYSSVSLFRVQRIGWASGNRVALAMGVARQTLAMYEGGFRNCPDARVSAWAKAVGTTKARALALFDAARAARKEKEAAK